MFRTKSQEERARELDRLLARGRLSRPEKERVLSNVLRGVAIPSPRSWIERMLVIRWQLAVPALVLLIAVPMVLRYTATTSVDHFRAKGTGGGPTVEASCAGVCTIGRTLLFRVHQLSEPAYLAAYAQGPDGKRIWHFPSPGGELPIVPAGENPQLLRRGVRIGQEQPPGKYVLHLFLLKHPATREAIAVIDAEKSPEVIAHVDQVLEIVQ